MQVDDSEVEPVELRLEALELLGVVGDLAALRAEPLGEKVADQVVNDEDAPAPVSR